MFTSGTKTLCLLLLAVEPFFVFADRHVTVWNTFELMAPETIIDTRGPVAITDDLEFSLFPLGAFYDIDVGYNTISMTVEDPSAAQFTFYDIGVADIYTFDLGAEVESVRLVGMGELNEFATVEVVAPMTVFDVPDNFGVGVEVPFTIYNGGVRVTIGPGSDISVIDTQLTLKYKLKKMGKKGKKGKHSSSSDDRRLTGVKGAHA